MLNNVLHVTLYAYGNDHESSSITSLSWPEPTLFNVGTYAIRAIGKLFLGSNV